MTATQAKEHPGAQRKKIKSGIFKSPIHYLILFSSLFTLFAIIKVNIEFAPENSFWNIELLDLKTSVTMLFATISLLYARNQFEQGFMPVLDYRILYNKENVLKFDTKSSDAEFLVCSLRNQSAVAIVTSIQYEVLTGDGVIECANYSDLIRTLKNRNLNSRVDFSLVHISEGWSLGTNDERVIFELVTTSLAASDGVKGVDIKLEFRSLLGDIYEKEIYCIPRRGIHC